MKVTKQDGRAETFNPNKLAMSLIASGVQYDNATLIVKQVTDSLFEGITTAELRTLVLNALMRIEPDRVAKYKKESDMYVRRSNGMLVPFNKKSIAESLQREAEVGADDAKRVARGVESKLKKMKLEYLTSSLVRETVCVQLLEEGMEEARTRYTRLGMPVYDVTRIIEYGIKENANLQHNPETVHKFAADQILKEYLFTRILPRDIADAHMNGDIHIHDADYFAVRPNCMQHDLRFFLQHGLRVDGTGNHTSVAGPAKHPMVAALQAAKIMASAQTNMAGGQSLDNFNIFMAPLLRGMKPDEVKQIAQCFVYEMNQQYVARGGQTVFSSMNLELGVPKYLAREQAIGPSGRIDGVYEDYEPESQMFADALLDVFLDGDAIGKPHLFPNTIIKVRGESFNDDVQRHLLLKTHKLFAKYGTPYILNLVPEWQHDAVNAMGCRTRLSGDWADKQGYDNPGMATMRSGNVQYNTVNLPRIALEAKTESRALEALDERLELIRKSLVIKHDIVDKRLHKNALLPFLVQKANGEEYYRFREATHTVGFVGLHEYVQALTGNPLEKETELGAAVLRHMREWTEEQTRQTGWRWTLTQSPAESTAGKFARLDLLRFGDRAIVKGDRKANNVYYTNSSHLAVDADVPLFTRAKIEGDYHPLCNGGHITHLFLGEGYPNPDGLLSLTEKICKSTNAGLFDYTRDLTVCKKCSSVTGGMVKACGKCGSTEGLEYYSRITGYCQRVGTSDSRTGGWNDGKVAELKDRRRYCL